MKRRSFLSSAALGAAAAGAGSSASSAAAPAAPPHAGRMKLGHQHHSTDEWLKLMSALGVNHICSDLPSRTLDQNWSVESLVKLRERIEAHGIKLEMVPLPMSSSYIARSENPSILLGDSGRDRAIDNICEMIRNCARAGIPAAKYNLTFLGVVRTESTKGRGGAMYSTFVYDKAKQDPPLTEAGKITEDIYWERIEYFLKRVVPVAAENKVRIACHPQDPGMPRGRGFRGVDTVLGRVDGLKKFIAIAESPYHGLNFCQGTVCEMLDNPDKEIHDVIRYFGSRKKIFNVHFRNIQGKFLDFRETFPDEGDIDFLKCIRTYKSVGYDGMLMPDHAPRIEGDAGAKQAFSFAFGYIRALIQMVYAES